MQKLLTISLVALIFPACGIDMNAAAMLAADGDAEGPRDTGAEPTSGAEPASGPGGQGGAGILTAADWDDNLNFEYYTSFLSNFYQQSNRHGLPALPHDRIVLEVVDDDSQPVADAHIAVTAGTSTTHLHSGSDGHAYYYPSLDGDAESFAIEVQALGDTTTAELAPAAIWQLQIAAAPKATTALDLALVIDTTGSMDDEIRYLQDELLWVIDTVAAAHPNVDLRLALVAYRDELDDYEVRSRDFTQDVDAFMEGVGELDAAGGGDYPESVAEGLAAAMDLSWRDDRAVRLLFLVGDAPPQPGRQATTVEGGLRARANGVRVFPVAASGVDARAEWVFRQLAQFTGGRYVFLTDDSGVGNTHAVPHIPCYLAQKLNALLVRIIESEITQTRIYPSTDDVIRTAGDPQGGECVVADQIYFY